MDTSRSAFFASSFRANPYSNLQNCSRVPTRKAGTTWFVVNTSKGFKHQDSAGLPGRYQLGNIGLMTFMRPIIAQSLPNRGSVCSKNKRFTYRQPESGWKGFPSAKAACNRRDPCNRMQPQSRFELKRRACALDDIVRGSNGCVALSQHAIRKLGRLLRASSEEICPAHYLGGLYMTGDLQRANFAIERSPSCELGNCPKFNIRLNFLPLGGRAEARDNDQTPRPAKESM
jgi:hypothetical protein